jgi:integrase
MEWGQIVENLHALPELPTPQNVTVRSSRPRDYLTEREVEKLMDAARENRLRRLCIFVSMPEENLRWWSSGRYGDPAGLPTWAACQRVGGVRWDDINLQAGKLHVRRSKGVALPPCNEGAPKCRSFSLIALTLSQPPAPRGAAARRC